MSTPSHLRWPRLFGQLGGSAKATAPAADRPRSSSTTPIGEKPTAFDGCGKGNGWGHICTETPDVYGACEELAAKGVNITLPSGPMKNSIRVIAFCEDLNDYKVELNESILKPI